MTHSSAQYGGFERFYSLRIGYYIDINIYDGASAVAAYE